MPKGYGVTFYRSISDPGALANDARLALAPIQAGGGRFLARGIPARSLEAGVVQRAVVIEFDSVAQALATYESPAYQAALRVLDGAAERDVRFLEGAE
jgi:uncharacterized protein (DUF1330 family)